MAKELLNTESEKKKLSVKSLHQTHLVSELWVFANINSTNLLGFIIRDENG